MGKKQTPKEKHANMMFLLMNKGSKLVKAQVAIHEAYRNLLQNKLWTAQTRVNLLKIYAADERDEFRKSMEAGLNPEKIHNVIQPNGS